MLHLSNPAGLWALAALALPLALHLWRPPARTVRLGSVRFLAGVPRRRWNNLCLRERWLLAARLLLLTLLALLLAAPVWRRPAPTTTQRWVLVSPGVAGEGVAGDRLRALLAAGYEPHGLKAGFPRLDSSAAAAGPPRGETDAAADAGVDVWSLLREADAGLPRGSELVVVTRGRVAELRGTRPVLRHCRAEWVQASPAPPDAERARIAALKLTGSGESARLDVSIGLSGPAATRYVARTIPAQAGRTPIKGANGEYVLEVNGAPGGEEGRWRARLLAADGKPEGEWVPAERPAALAALILHDADRQDEARYVEAALQAAGQVSGREVAVTSKIIGAADLAALPKPGWTFWLSHQPASESGSGPSAVDAGRLFVEATEADAPLTVSRMIQPVDVALPGLPSGADVPIHRRVYAPSSAANVPLWTDGFGEPLLTVARAGNGGRIDFHSRLHPAWNDLPRTGALTVMMLSLFTDDHAQPTIGPDDDRRIAGATQGAPTFSEDSRANANDASSEDRDVDLHTLFWATALICFGVERFMSRLAAGNARPPGPVPAPRPSLVEVRT